LLFEHHDDFPEIAGERISYTKNVELLLDKELGFVGHSSFGVGYLGSPNAIFVP
jgi:hypothetical protein